MDSIKIKNGHKKIIDCINTLLIDSFINMPYYGNFNLNINFNENDNISTCGVNITTQGMNLIYSPSFFDIMSQKEVNFIMLHEDFHLLFDHPKRVESGQYEYELSNIAQDMIINHIIVEDITPSFIDIPKYEDGTNMALFVPIEYTGKLIFEELYNWLKDRKDKWSKDRKQKGENISQTPKYGPYSKNPKNPDKPLESFSLEEIFENMEKNEGEYLDKHICDDITKEIRDCIIKNINEKLKSRGYMNSKIEKTLNKLQKKRKDYLKEIKRTISNLIFGNIPIKTLTRPNRKQITGLKGYKKIKTKINCILDTSGSMNSTFDRVVSYIYRDDIEVNLIEADTKVRLIENIKSKKKLQSLRIVGLGGTILQPAIDLVCEKFNNVNTLILTDGYCDKLNISRIKGNILIISTGKKVPISKSKKKVKQIILPDIDESRKKKSSK